MLMPKASQDWRDCPLVFTRGVLPVVDRVLGSKSGVLRAGFIPVRDEVHESSAKRAFGGCLGAKRR
jgi:hypothetical protein